MGKGSKRRPTLITREEEELNWKRFQGLITWKEYEKKFQELKKKNLIRRR